MKCKIGLPIIYLITLFIVIIFCSKEPTEPQTSNPFDPENPNTQGDPFNLTAQIANGGITLNWTTPSIEGLQYFKIYRSEQETSGYSSIHQADNATFQYVDTAIANGHSYWYRVAALNTNGKESSLTNTAAVNIKTEPVLVINGGDKYTTIKEVNLTILANTAQQMMLSNNQEFGGANWENYTTSKNWTLLTGEGEKIVYMKVKYDNGNESVSVNASILPQPMNPGITIAGGAQYTPTRNVQLTLLATGSDLRMKVSQDSTFTLVDWQNYSSPLNFELSNGVGTKTVYARFKNDFEIESEVASDNILPQPMNPEIIIAGGVQYTPTRNVQITLSASGTNLMTKVSQDSTFTEIDWENYSSPINFVLSTGSGNKTVYAMFKNDFEIESNIVSDIIYLDIIPPTPVLTISPDSGVTNETNFQFNPTGSYDNFWQTNTLKARYDWENDGIWDTNWQILQVLNNIYTVGGGNKIARMELRDSTGWTADTTVPVYVNTRPIAQFTAAQNLNDYSFHFDASASSDYEDGTNLQYRWDWENNGTWDTDWLIFSTTNHQFGDFEQYTIKLEVHDIGNLTDTKTNIVYAGNVTDKDGNIYHTVNIGTQVWLVENLKVTRYRNGESIPNITDNAQWSNLTSGAYCNYNNDINNVATYGRLYNWYAVNDSRGLAPAGWHIPIDAEWDILANFLGGSATAGGALKDTILWKSPNTGATNSSGFSAFPGGYRSLNGNFDYLGDYAFFWSSTEYNTSNAWRRTMNYNDSRVVRYNYDKRSGFSVRCVRD
jgi:uncharacterized protein (TIGR02145 family)